MKSDDTLATPGNNSQEAPSEGLFSFRATTRLLLLKVEGDKRISDLGDKRRSERHEQPSSLCATCSPLSQD